MFPSRRITLGGGDVFRDEYSLEFDGTNDYVELASPFESTFGASFSVSCWFKADDGLPLSGTSEAIFGARDGDSRVYLYIEDSGKIFVIYDVEGTSINAQSASAELTDGQQPWKHLVLVIDDTANQISIYLDNKLVTLDDGDNDGDIGSTDLSTYASTRNMFIGSASNNGSRNLDFAGKISEWVLYSTALTASQVATLYNGREPYNHKEGIATGNLVGWWRMGDGTERSSGTTIYDMSANSNNGTMTNFPAGAFNGDTP